MPAYADAKAWHRSCNLWRSQNNLSYVDVPPTEALAVVPGVPIWDDFASATWQYMNLYRQIFLAYSCPDDAPGVTYAAALYCRPTQNELNITGLDRKLKFVAAFEIENDGDVLINQILAGTLFADPTIAPVNMQFYEGCNIALKVLIGEPETWPKFATSVNVRNTP